jgi:hypothetical protein
MKMTSNGKTLNYKVVDLIESYNFHIKFTSIRVQKLQMFENRLNPTAVAHGGSRRYGTARVPWVRSVSAATPMALDVCFANFFTSHIFLQKKKEKC